MPDETPAGAPAPIPPAGADEAATPVDGASTTPRGDVFTAADEAGANDATPGAASAGRGIHPALLIAAAIVPAVIVGIIVWFVSSGGSSGGSGSDRISGDVSNIVTAFSQGQSGTVSTTYEGKLPPGYPSGVPAYPGAKVISSVLQIRGADAGYLVIFDSSDSRSKVASYYGDQFGKAPWQISAGQDSVDSTLHQFSKIDDPNITGLVIIGQSKETKITTIVESLQVTAGGQASQNAANATFTLPTGRNVPDGFPVDVPPYKDAPVLEGAFQKQAGGVAFAVSFLTKDSGDDALTYYRDKLQAAGLTVTDADASASSLKNAKAIKFVNGQQTLSGTIVTGTFADDTSYTRIDIQAQTSKGPPATSGSTPSAATPPASTPRASATPAAVPTP